MVERAESSKPSVNERLARAREEDLRRCRNLQAKLARQDAQDQHLDLTRKPHSISHHASSSSRTGILFLSSTELAKRESDQRSRERQLKRQVAGPIPPQSWRDDFDRLSVRRGVASGFDRQRLQDLVLSTAGARGEAVKSEDRHRRQGMRRDHTRICAGFRFYLEEGGDEGGGRRLSLQDSTLCVIADALNRPSVGEAGKSKDHGLAPDMDRSQLSEVLGYLPRHMRERMLALCGRLAATDWSLSEWTAQEMAKLDKPGLAATQDSQADTSEDAADDWEASLDRDPHSAAPLHPKDGSTTLDLSYSNVLPRTLSRLLSTTSFTAVSLTTLSLAGWTASSLDSPAMHSILAQLPNLQLLSLAGARLSLDAGGMEDAQRAGMFLRKLSRSCAKLETLDLSFCAWVSAEAVIAVPWATQATVRWPRLGRLLLVGCKALSDPRRASEAVMFDGTPAANHIAQWHTTHSQRANATGALYDAATDTLHHDPFELFSAPVQRSSARATFSDYVDGSLQPPIITHMTSSRHDADGHAEASEGAVLMEYVRCPRSAGKVEMWLWQRARILDAVRGRVAPLARQRRWIDVYF